MELLLQGSRKSEKVVHNHFNNNKFSSQYPIKIIKFSFQHILRQKYSLKTGQHWENLAKILLCK